jgi:serine/threonine-protein kinase
VAAKANSLEGEVASHTRKLEALERRGRALRAEIGRKVEELAQEESRSLREAAAYAEEEEAARLELARAQQIARDRQYTADQAERAGTATRAIYEAAGAAKALIDAKRDWLRTREERRAARETTARELRRQIEELRAQLGRYAEALEEDLQAGREKVANRSREGLRFEKLFLDASSLLVGHLRGKPECRELMAELNAPSVPSSQAASSMAAASGAAAAPAVSRTA